MTFPALAELDASEDTSQDDGKGSNDDASREHANRAPSGFGAGADVVKREDREVDDHHDKLEDDADLTSRSVLLVARIGVYAQPSRSYPSCQEDQNLHRRCRR